MRKDNPRMDALSRKRYAKSELFRIVGLPSPRLEEDVPLPGRGVYLHKDKATVELARKKHLLEKAFQGKNCDGIYALMEEKL